MLLYKYYDETKKEQEAWYDSSMIAYTRMTEDEFEKQVMRMTLKIKEFLK